ncbi:glycoside hydrolase family 16 protein [Siphonobacter aquaeclarae]|uniref:Glycosyl hydrolases family 16 n=1 Tax=Siphonobacter aquaeclarae TaxID=563176 RepID=A0A1G9UL74_9BACT|nr:glycoside hydrolase family 16 protein [Siphonobacter aquaeclarae]SDM60648.1 Glycosyl hydrolases family 16 [Siphonobacter aquaeclarae]
MKRSLLLLLSGSLLFCGKEDPRYSFETTPVWSDEFNYSGLPDPKKWGYDVGGGGWGNNELEYYTKDRTENARVENGKLIIEARKEDYQGRQYTSARLVTKGKGDWTYGKIVVRARLPKGRGTWPAIWTLASQSDLSKTYWPDNGEIDIMEHVGYDPNRIHATVHTKAFNHVIHTQKNAQKVIPDAMESFHDYAIEWTPASIKAFIDGEQYFTFSNTGKGWQEWPFDKPQHLLLNIAVGGNWGGKEGVDESIFPQKMEVEYVRVYRMKRE